MKANKERKSQAGCNPMIRKLYSKGVQISEAYAKVSRKFGFGKPRDGVPAWFTRIWKTTKAA